MACQIAGLCWRALAFVVLLGALAGGEGSEAGRRLGNSSNVTSPPSQKPTEGAAAGEITNLKNENAKLVEQAASQTSEISALKAEVKSGTLQIAAANDAIAKLKSSAEDLQGQLTKQLEDVKLKEKENAQLQEWYHNELNAKQELNVRIKEQTSQIETLSDLANTKSEENGKLAEEVKSQTAEVNRLTQKTEALQGSLDKSTGQLNDLNTHHSGLEEEHEDLETKYADPSVQHFLSRKAIKAYHHPGIEGAANKTFTYVLPSMRLGHAKGTQWLAESQDLAKAKLNAHVGSTAMEPWLPLLSGFLVYGMVGCPLLCSLWCLTTVICRLRPCLLFLHLYFAFTALCAGGFALYTKSDTLTAFAVHDASVYLAAQVGFAIALLLYMVFLLFAYSCSRSGTSEPCLRRLQILAALVIGGFYFSLVWTPAMLDQLPKTAGLTASAPWACYAIAMVLFFIALRLEQLSWRAQGGSPQRAGAPSIAIREDGELRGVGELTELATFIGNATATKES